MLGRTHQLIGISAGLATFLYYFPVQYSPATFGTAMVAAHLASLLPDIDQPASMIWRSLPGGRIAGEIVNPFLQHRNLTHSILGSILIGFGIHKILTYFPSYWGVHTNVVFIVAMVSYISHLLADMVTVEGMPLLFPAQRMFGIPPHPFAGLRIETGHWFENLLIFPSVNVVLFGLIYVGWPLIKLTLIK